MLRTKLRRAARKFGHARMVGRLTSAAGVHLPRLGRLRGVVGEVRREEFSGRGAVTVARDVEVATRPGQAGLPPAAEERFNGLSVCRYDAFFCAEISRPFVVTDTGWVVTEDRRLLLESLADEAFIEKRSIRERWLWPRVRSMVGKAVHAYPHWAVDNYYHWMLEFLPRLAPVLDGRVSAEWSDAKILVPPLGQSWMRESLAIVGVAKELLHETAGEQLQCERLLFCSPLGHPMNTPRWAIDWLRSRFLGSSGIGAGRRRRILVSRRHASKRRIINEEEIEKVAAGEGFETVALEGLPVVEQARLFASAEMVLAPHGAGLANLVFAQGAKVVEIFEPGWVRPSFCALGLDAGNSYKCLIGRTVDGAHIWADPNEVRSLLRSF